MYMYLNNRQMVFALPEEIQKYKYKKDIDKNTFFYELSAAAGERGGGS